MLDLWCESDAMQRDWCVPISKFAEKCENPCDVVLSWQQHPHKTLINLSKDDLDVKPSKEISDSLKQTIIEGKFNGYGPAVGHEDARLAVSHYLAQYGADIDQKNIILCSGCSSALDIAITALADGTKAQNILIPSPANPIYRILGEGLGIELRAYNLLEDYNWKADLYQMESQIDAKTAAILISNPSHVTGTLLKDNNLRELIEIAFRHKIPLISDESLQQLIFPEHTFTSTAVLSPHVPVLICGGMSKGFLVAGWRIGWIAIWDPVNAFEQTRKGLVNLSQRIIGCNTVMQGALSGIIHSIPENFNEDLVNTLKERVRLMYEALEKIGGLQLYLPHGTMYMIVKIHLEAFRHIQSSLQFAKLLYEEEGVLCMPGEVFGSPGFMRLSLAQENQQLEEAAHRIKTFSMKYSSI